MNCIHFPRPLAHVLFVTDGVMSYTNYIRLLERYQRKHVFQVTVQCTPTVTIRMEWLRCRRIYQECYSLRRFTDLIQFLFFIRRLIFTELENESTNESSGKLWGSNYKLGTNCDIVFGLKNLVHPPYGETHNQHTSRNAMLPVVVSERKYTAGNLKPLCSASTSDDASIQSRKSWFRIHNFAGKL